MRNKQILLTMVVLVFTASLYAQTTQPAISPGVGQDPTLQDPSHPTARCDTVRDDYMQGITGTQVSIKVQQEMRKQLEDDIEKQHHLLTEKALMDELGTASAEKVITDVRAHGVDFDLTPSIEKRLRKAKASDDVITAVRQAGPKVRANLEKSALGLEPAAMQNAPQEQARDLATLMSQSSPDKTIALADRFAKKYPQSTLLSCVYAFAADAYQQQGDLEKVVEYTSKSLKANHDNLMALVVRLGVLPLPQYLRNHAADRDQVLQEAENEGQRALRLIQQTTKPANGTDGHQEDRLAEAASQIHASLGIVHLELATGGRAAGGPNKAELAKAEMELNIALTTTHHPDARDCYRLGEAYALDGKLEAAAQAFRTAGALGHGTLIATYSEEQIAQINKRKAQGALASNVGTVSGK
jgi:tetratricopeptide (TPR) repeat protein